MCPSSANAASASLHPPLAPPRQPPPSRSTMERLRWRRCRRVAWRQRGDITTASGPRAYSFGWFFFYTPIPASCPCSPCRTFCTCTHARKRGCRDHTSHLHMYIDCRFLATPLMRPVYPPPALVPAPSAIPATHYRILVAVRRQLAAGLQMAPAATRIVVDGAED